MESGNNMGLGVTSIQPKQENIPGRGHQSFTGHTHSGMSFSIIRERQMSTTVSVSSCLQQNSVRPLVFYNQHNSSKHSSTSDLKCLSGSDDHLSNVFLMMHIFLHTHLPLLQRTGKFIQLLVIYWLKYVAYHSMQSMTLWLFIWR